MIFRHGTLSRRDAFLLLIGASSMHIWTLIFNAQGLNTDQSIVINTHVSQQDALGEPFTTTAVVKVTETTLETITATVTELAAPTSTSRALSPFDDLPPTDILAHAPGWTLFRNVYMSNGTLFIVADEAGRKKIPEIRMMTSTGLEAVNTPENIALREPTPDNMRIISPEEAKERWVFTTEDAKRPSFNRVWSVEGNTLLFNDPPQFLNHYYHFVAELFFGAQAFWHGAFSEPISTADALSPSSATHYSLRHPHAPPIHRAIFAHASADAWRDNPGFNSYFLRAALPSLVVENQVDWDDRIRATRPKPGEPQTDARAWHFPVVLLTDRSAAHRGAVCGSQTQRTAAEAWDFMRLRGKLRGLHVGGWWAPLREAVWRFAGAEEGLAAAVDVRKAKDVQQKHFTSETGEVLGLDGTLAALDAKMVTDVGVENQNRLPKPDKIVISYISRQSARSRKLIANDHKLLVESLEELVARKNEERAVYLERKDKKPEDVPLEYELTVVEAEKLTHDQQIRMAARTTIMLGVHGNGLTHLVFMKPNRASTVIELFFPGGFAHDYYWTSRALGMRHLAVWNDTHRAYPNKPDVNYPEGFQGDFIPVHGPTVVQLIEDRVAMKL